MLDLVIPPGPGVSAGLVIPASVLREHFSRSSGPGGQGVNTTDSRVQLRIALDEIPDLTAAQRTRLETNLAPRLVDGVLTTDASEHRSQHRNRVAARVRLAAVIREALAPPPRTRRPTRPSRGAVERRLAAKRVRSQLKTQRRSVDD